MAKLEQDIQVTLSMLYIFPTLYFNLRVNLLGPKFHSQPRGLLDFVVSLVLDPKVSGS